MAPRLAQLEDRLGEQDEAVRRQIRAQVLPSAGYARAAYEEAWPVARATGAPRALAVAKAALERLGLEGSPLRLEPAARRRESSPSSAAR